MKLLVSDYLQNQGYPTTDHGCPAVAAADYPAYAIAAAQAAAASLNELAVVICGSGMGVSISANKVPGARCAVVWCEAVAEFARRHSNANVLAFSADLQTFIQVQRCLTAFLRTEFEGGRHQRRLDQIAEFELHQRC